MTGTGADPSPPRRTGLAPALLVLAVGAGLSALAFRQAWQLQRQQVEADFRSAARDRIEAIGRGLQHGFEAVLSLRDALAASGPPVDPRTFRAVAAPLHGRHPYLQALQWLPEIRPDNRAGMELALRGEDPKLGFFSRDPAGITVPLPAEATFHAVALVEPRAGNEVTLGYAAVQVPTRMAALRRALATGGPAATGPIRLLQEPGRQSGFLVMAAVPGPDGRPAGVVQGVFRAGDLVRKSVAFLEPRGVSLRLASHSSEEPSALLHLEASRIGATGAGDPLLRLVQEFDLAGRRWTVTAGAEPGSFPLGPGWRAWVVLGTGLAFSVLAAGYLRSVLERAAAVRSLVEVRTAELMQETERHRQDAEALRRSEARYRHLVDRMDEGMWLLDRDGRTTFANRRLQELLGHPAAVLAGRPLADFLHPEAAPQLPGLLQAWLDGTGEACDLRFVRADGGDLWAIASGSRLAAQDRDGTGVLVMLTDVTERRRAEQHQLQSQKLESLGVLAGGIAHDFNNLLAAILGNLDLARQELGSTGRAEAPLNRLEQAVQRAAHLARQMLAYSGKGQFQVTRMDLNQAVQEISHLISVSVPKKVVFRAELQPGLPALTADPAQIQQVVMNLITNAAEAIGDGEGVVTLRTGREDWSAAELGERFPGQPMAAGSYLTLAVQDTGCGMPPEIQARIFEPFFTTKFTGRGLGLAALQGIVRAHRGGISIASAPGRGTTFLLAFPTDPAELPDPGKGAPEQGWRGSGTILLVEDEAELREATAALLASLGFAVVPVGDGIAAIDRFRAEPGGFRAVLLDYTMPRLNGLETCRELRRIDPHCRVVLSSGYREPSSATEAGHPGFAAFLPKPFTRQELAQALRTALETP